MVSGMAQRPSLRERSRRRTEQEIRQAAVELFEERGFPGTSVDDIAAAAGVSRSTLFRYFPTKDELLFRRDPSPAQALALALARAVLATPLDEVRTALIEVQMGQGGGPYAQRVAALVEREPALRAAEARLSQEVVEVVSRHLTRRGVEAPRAQMLAAALMGALGAARRLAASGSEQPERALGLAFETVAPVWERWAPGE